MNSMKHLVIGMSLTLFQIADAQDEIQISEEDLLPDTIVIPAEGLPEHFLEGELPDAGYEAIPIPREAERFGQEIEQLYVQPEPGEDDGDDYLEALDGRVSTSYQWFPDERPSDICNDVVIHRSISVYPLGAHLRGDLDMSGDRVTITIEGEVVHSFGRIFVRGDVDMSARPSGNSTHFRRSFEQVIYQVPTGNCWIRGIKYANSGIVWKPQDGGRIQGISPTNSHEFRVYRPSPQTQSPWQLFESATCRSDTRGPDLGRIGCTTIRIQSLVVDLEERGDCNRRLTMPMPANGWRAYNRGFRDLFPIARLSGNNRIDGTVDARVNSRIEWNATTVSLFHHVHMRERGNDRTTYGSATRSNYLDARRDTPGCIFSAVTSPELEGSLTFTDRNNYWMGRSGTGHLERVWCRTHNPGNDDRRLGCIRFEYDGGRPLVIQLADAP